MLRKLLVGSAHYILGPFGSDSDLRRHGEKIASRGGKNAKKRAAVAVARKLSVLLHHLWITGEVYRPALQHASTPRAGGGGSLTKEAMEQRPTTEEVRTTATAATTTLKRGELKWRMCHGVLPECASDL